MGEEELRAVAERLLDRTRERLARKDIEFCIMPEALEELSRLGYDPIYGARPLRRVLRQRVEEPLAELLISETIGPGDRVQACIREGRICLEKVDEAMV